MPGDKKAQKRALSKKKNYLTELTGLKASVQQFHLQPFNSKKIDYPEFQKFILDRQSAVYIAINQDLSSDDFLYIFLKATKYISTILLVYPFIFGFPSFLEDILNRESEILLEILSIESNSFILLADSQLSAINKNSMCGFNFGLIFNLVVFIFSWGRQAFSSRNISSFQNCITDISETFAISQLEESNKEFQIKFKLYLEQEEKIKKNVAQEIFPVLVSGGVFLFLFFALFFFGDKFVFQEVMFLGVFFMFSCFLNNSIFPIIYRTKQSVRKNIIFKDITDFNSHSLEKIQFLLNKLNKALIDFKPTFTLQSRMIGVEILEDKFLKHLSISCYFNPNLKLNYHTIKNKYYLDLFKRTVDHFFSLKSFFCPKAKILVFYEDGEKKLREINDERIHEASKWLKKGALRLSKLQENIDHFYKLYKKYVDEGRISIAFEVGKTEEYSIKAYASFAVSGEQYYEVDIEDPKQFPLLMKKGNDYDFNKINNSPAVKKQVQPREKSKTRGIPNPQLLTNQKNNVPPDELQNPDVCDSCEVSAGKYVLRIPQFGLFSTYEQGKIEKALQATADRVDSKTNMPRWLKQDSLGKQGVKRLAVMNNEGSEKGYSLKTNRYKMRLYGAEEGLNAQGQTIIAFKYSLRFGH